MTKHKYAAFAQWLEAELAARDWIPATLANRAHVDPAQLSRILSMQRGAGLDTCVGIAQAFGYPPELVLRQAGLLPPEPPPVTEEKEAATLLRQLPAQLRQAMIATMRALVGTAPAAPHNVTEHRAAYDTPHTLAEWLAWHIAQDAAQLSEEEARAVFDLMKRIRDRAPEVHDGEMATN